MARSQKTSAGMLSLMGLIALSTPGFAADNPFVLAQSGSGGNAGASSSGSSGGGTQQGQRQMFEQQRSDKTQQGQQMINEQTMKEQQPQQGNTGANLSGGRDSHLGPHDTGSQGMQGGGGKSGR